MTTTRPSNWPVAATGLIAGPSAPYSLADVVAGGTAGRPDLDHAVHAELHVLPAGDDTIHTVPSSHRSDDANWRAVDGAQCDCWPSVRLSRDGQHVTRIVTHHPAEETR